jgi:nucleoside-diphosphate-sugar epimerase
VQRSIVSLHLVTGGAGFVGSHTAEYLLDRGEDVRLFDRAPPSIPGTDLEDRVDYVRGDVRDVSAVRRALRSVDYVHHNVALVPLTKAGREFWEVNVGGTDNVVRLAGKEGVEGVTHVSSSAVYDLSRMPVTENTPVNPIGQYGMSKLAADQVALQHAAKGVPVNIIRPRTVVDERRAGIYQILFDWVDRDARVWMLGDGSNLFQLVSARDLADASLRAAETDVTGEIVNIGNADYTTLGEDLEHLIDYADSASTIQWIPAKPASLLLQAMDALRISPLAPWHYKTVHRPYYFDVSKARDVLGWEPVDSNFDVFERAYDWYASNDIETMDDHGSAHRTAPKQRALRVLRTISRW